MKYFIETLLFISNLANADYILRTPAGVDLSGVDAANSVSFEDYKSNADSADVLVTAGCVRANAVDGVYPDFYDCRGVSNTLSESIAISLDTASQMWVFVDDTFQTALNNSPASAFEYLNDAQGTGNTVWVVDNTTDILSGNTLSLVQQGGGVRINSYPSPTLTIGAIPNADYFGIYDAGITSVSVTLPSLMDTIYVKDSGLTDVSWASGVAQISAYLSWGDAEIDISNGLIDDLSGFNNLTGIQSGFKIDNKTYSTRMSAAICSDINSGAVSVYHGNTGPISPATSHSQVCN